MKKIIRVHIALLVFLLALYGAGVWSINRDQQVQSNAIASQASPADGMKYYEYCSGGLSDTITTIEDTSCLAERPGDFAKFALALYMFMFYIASLIIGFVYQSLKQRLVANKTVK